MYIIKHEEILHFPASVSCPVFSNCRVESSQVSVAAWAIVGYLLHTIKKARNDTAWHTPKEAENSTQYPGHVTRLRRDLSGDPLLTVAAVQNRRGRTKRWS